MDKGFQPAKKGAKLARYKYEINTMTDSLFSPRESFREVQQMRKIAVVRILTVQYVRTYSLCTCPCIYMCVNIWIIIYQLQTNDHFDDNRASLILIDADE